jgi:F0F1-type ATP synthase membrane subunit c/vacuolar-type H+-ATPase subunit K
MTIEWATLGTVALVCLAAGGAIGLVIGIVIGAIVGSLIEQRRDWDEP